MLREMWFSGDHADFGESWAPEEEKPLLYDIPFAWMIGQIEQLEKGASELAIAEAKKLEILNSSQRSSPSAAGLPAMAFWNGGSLVRLFCPLQPRPGIR